MFSPDRPGRFVKKLSDRDQMQLELANDSVHSSTEKVGLRGGWRRACGRGGRGGGRRERKPVTAFSGSQ